jgi:hypothetical protein
MPAPIAILPADLAAFIDKLYRLGSIRGVTKSRLQVINRRYNNDIFMFALSIAEPSTANLPFNVLWVNFDSTSAYFKMLLRRTGKEPDLIIPNCRNSWQVITSLEDVYSEMQVYDIFDSTLTGDTLTTLTQPQAATLTTSGIFKVKTDADANTYPRAVGTNDLRLVNSRLPRPHVHSEFNDQPGVEFAALPLPIDIGNSAQPEEGDVLFLEAPPVVGGQSSTGLAVGGWRKPKVSDIDGYISPTKSIALSGPSAALFIMNENATVSYSVTATLYTGRVVDVTEYSVFQVSGIPNSLVTGNSITFGGVTSSGQATITVTYQHPVTHQVKTLTKIVGVLDVPAPQSLSIIGATDIDELSSETYTARCAFTDGSIKNVTAQWTLENSTVGSFTGNVLSTNDIKAVAGDRRLRTNLIATYTDSTLSVPVTVTATLPLAILDKTPVLPVSMVIVGDSSIQEGLTKSYISRVYYNNGLYADKTIGTTWSVPGNPALVTLFSGETPLRVEASRVLADAQTVLTATYVEGEVTLTVNKTLTLVARNVIAELRIDGAVDFNDNQSQEYTAQVVYDDGLTKDVSADIIWTIEYDHSDPQNAGTIWFNSTDRLLIAGDVAGDLPVTITATYITEDGGLYTATKVVIVRDITVYPAALEIVGSATLNESTESDYTAQITYTDGSVATHTALWSTSAAVNIARFVGATLKIGNLTEDLTIPIAATYTEKGVTVVGAANVALTFSPPTALSYEILLSSLSAQTPPTIFEETSIPSPGYRMSENSSGVVIHIRVLLSDGTTEFSPLTNFDLVSSDPTVLEISAEGVVTTYEAAADTPITLTLSLVGTVTPLITSLIQVINIRVPVSIAWATGTPFATGLAEAMELTSTSPLVLEVTYDDGGKMLEPMDSVLITVTPSGAGVVSVDPTTLLPYVTFAAVTHDTPITITATHTIATLLPVTHDMIIKPASVVGMAVKAAGGATTVNEGSSLELILELIYSNGLHQDITGSVDAAAAVWSISHPEQATFGSALSTMLLNALAVVRDTPVVVTVDLNGMTATLPLTLINTGANLTGITLTAPTSAVNELTALALTVTANWSDATTTDVTSLATYVVDPVSAGTVDAAGSLSATAVTEDTDITVTATYEGEPSSALSLTVINVPAVTSMNITATVAEGFIGETAQLGVDVIYDDATTATNPSGLVWNCSSPLVTVSVNGLVEIVGEPSTADDETIIISAVHRGFTQPFNFVVKRDYFVSIAINSSELVTVLEENTLQLEVKATHLSGKTEVITSSATYISANESVVTVDATGAVLAKPFTTAIPVIVTAEYVTTNVSSVTPNPATITDVIEVSVQQKAMSGLTLTALPTYLEQSATPVVVTAEYDNGTTLDISDDATLTFGSTAPAAAILEIQGGVVTLVTYTVAVDTPATLTVTRDLFTASADISVTAVPDLVRVVITSPLSPSSQIAETQEVQLSLTGYYSDDSSSVITTGVTWTSTDTAVADVDSSGHVDSYSVIGFPAKSTTITAEYLGLTAEYLLIVYDLGSGPLSVTSLQVTDDIVTDPRTVVQNQVFNVVVTANYSDSSSAVVTNDSALTWTVTPDGAVAFVQDGVVTAGSAASPTVTTLTFFFGGENAVVTSYSTIPA